MANKNMGGLLSGLAGSMTGIGGEDNPAPDPFQMMQGFLNNQGRDSGYNPGMQMFQGVSPQGVDPQGSGSPIKKGGNSFLSRFAGSLGDQLFQKAMMGFMGRGPY